MVKGVPREIRLLPSSARGGAQVGRAAPDADTAAPSSRAA